MSTLSTLQRNIIKFKDYTKNQIFDILKYRANISLKEGTFTDDLIEMICELINKNGDIRYGLNLLWRAVKIAESKNLKYLTKECIRLGNQDLMPYSTHDILTYMSSHRLIFLLAIIKALKKSEKQKISITEILDTYYVICENLSILKRSYSQLWNYLQDLKKEDIISIQIKSDSIKGRKALIEVLNISLKKFETAIINILESKGIRI